VKAAAKWMEQGVVIPLYGRLLFGVSVFRAAFRFLPALPIIIAFLLLALLTRWGFLGGPARGR
jgi:hypothetical protein